MENKSQLTDWAAKVIDLLVLLIVIMLTKTIITINFASYTNFYVLPIVGLFVVILIFAIAKFTSIYSKKEVNTRKLRSGLSIILVLGGISLFWGFYGYFASLYGAANDSSYSGIFGIITTVIRDNETMFFSGVTRAVQYTGVIIVSSYVAILTGLIWFLLSNKVKQLEQV